jgi:hypothetical protein
MLAERACEMSHTHLAADNLLEGLAAPVASGCLSQGAVFTSIETTSHAAGWAIDIHPS